MGSAEETPCQGESFPQLLVHVCLCPLRNQCMKMCLEDESWRWHARYGHINFDALQLLVRCGMVHGLPSIEHTDVLCEACLAGK
jgi:hypothetical protein